MKKTILIPIMLILFSFVFVNATLVDSEDFESYTPNVDIVNMINESGGEWNCTTGIYPSCVDGIDDDGDGYSSYLQVQEDVTTSQFLRVQSNGADMYGILASGDYSYATIDWDSIPSTTNVWTNSSFVYDVKLFSFDCGTTLSNTLDDSTTFYMRLEPSNKRFSYTPLGTSYQHISPLILGYQSNDSNESNSLLGLGYDTQTNDNYPLNSTLSLNDGEWHRITTHYFFNSTSHLVRIDEYDDGVLINSQSANQPYAIHTTQGFFEGIKINSGRCFDIGIDNIEMYQDELVPATAIEEEEENCSTSCSTWTDPYYLNEEFNGSINLCDWATLENVCFDGELERETTDGYYSAFKESDLLSETNSRYATISLELKPNSVDTNGYLAISVYDEEYVRYIQFFLSDDMNFYNNEGGSVELVYSNVTNSTYKTVQLHLDFTNNDFDLWYDDVKVSESLGLSNNFYDSTNINGLRISSSSIDYDIDNVQIYSSDQNNELLPSDTVIVAPIDDTTSMCGLFYKEEPSCSVDSDCLTDDCKPNGKCNRFDMNYCDENGHTRGNKCFIGAVTYCTLDSTQEIILDNFLLFLVFIVIIIFIVYLIFLIKS